MLPSIHTKEPHEMVADLRDLLSEAGKVILEMDEFTDLPEDANHILNRILNKVRYVDEWLQL